MDSYDILVIILSGTLAIFLVLAIIATIKFIKLLDNLKSVSGHLETAAKNIEGASSLLQKGANFSFITTLFKTVTSSLRNKSGKES